MKPLIPYLFASFLGLAGCGVSYQAGPPPAFGPDRQAAPEVAARMERLAAEGERNWVLNLDELAIEALRVGDVKTAEDSLDEAILLIEAIYGDSDSARASRSLWEKEGAKVFKGDPYERSMVYFVRGILYMREADWENARACFRSALYHDSLAEEEQKRADWALFHYLVGVCETQLDRPTYAEEAFAKARELAAAFPANYGALRKNLEWSRIGPAPIRLTGALPEFDAETNLLVLTMQGRAPRKVGVGQFGEYLTYAPGGGYFNAASVQIDGKTTQPVVIADSVYYQAITRGGRELDAILDRQAIFKGNLDIASEMALLGGAVALAIGADNRDKKAAGVGLGLLVVAGLTYLVMDAIKPEADTRAWSSISDFLAVGAYRAEPGGRRLTVNPGDGAKACDLQVPPPGRGLAVALLLPPPTPVLLCP